MMWNTLKAALWQAKRSEFLYIAVGYVILSQVMFIIPEYSDSMTGSRLVGICVQSLMVFLPILIGWNTAVICGSDLGDKTVNYELLFGKKRSEVYFGRFLAAIIINLAFVAVYVPIFPLIGTVINGWGGSISVSDAMMHYAAIFPVVFRLICVYTAITFLAMNAAVPAAFSFIGTIICMLSSVMLQEFDAKVKLTWQLATTDLIRLLDFNNTTSGYFEGQDITVYKTALTGSIMLESLTASVLIGIAVLLLGFAVFRKRDVM